MADQYGVGSQYIEKQKNDEQIINTQIDESLQQEDKNENLIDNEKINVYEQKNEDNILIEKNQFNSEHQNINVKNQKEANPFELKGQKQTQKQEEKNKVNDEYNNYVIRFHSDFAKTRPDDKPAIAAIRQSMAAYFEELGKIEEKEEDRDDYQRDELDARLQDIESKCNSFLRFRVSFSKSARALTAQVKEVREQAKNRREYKNLEDEGKIKTQGVGKSIKNFFTKRIPKGFKNVGRSIKKTFTNTYSNRSFGQVAKGVMRDHIWGGVFRNIFNTAAMAVALPFWMANMAVKGGAKLLEKVSGGKIKENVTVMPLPMPHLPSTWTRYHQELAREKELKEEKDKKEQDEVELSELIEKVNEESKTNLLSNSKESSLETPSKNIFFRVFGWHPNLDRERINKFENFEEIAKRGEDEYNYINNIISDKLENEEGENGNNL